MDSLSPRNARQAGCGNGLPVALVVLPGHVKCDPLGQLRKLHVEDLAGAGHHVVSAGTRGDATEHQDMPDLIKGCEMRDAVTEIGAESFVNLPRSPIAIEHQCLNVLQTL